VESSGVQWSPVDSYRTKGGRVKPSLYLKWINEDIMKEDEPFL